MRHDYFKAEDFDPQPRVMLYFWIVVLLLFIAIVGMICYALGDKRGFENGKKHAAIATRIVPAANPPPSLYPCTVEGHQEYDRTCRAQKRMTRIGVGS